ncbi:hypothetical protein [Mesorhizobium sp. 131-3-5]|uniref:hypothetical protein n=1 Tax=Mesorhizobium sp. 131-3-5 TaxID=2744520 RepID=UPI0019259E44|nr:hypothetical protein [Mesorhizobium sp. 131-3-5]
MPASGADQGEVALMGVVHKQDAWVSAWIANISDEERASFASNPTSALADLSTCQKLALGHGRVRRRKKGRAFSLPLAQLREIEKIISSRYGQFVPETDDADVFIKAAFYAVNDHCHKVEADFEESARGWCARWAPWALPQAGSVIRPILNEMVRRKHMLGAQAVAHLLQVGFLERERLHLFTIGACDISECVRKAIVKDRKRKRDKARQAANRVASGRQNRASSLAQIQPWVAEGISRRTWFRRRGTALSRVEIYTAGDITVPTSQKAASRRPSPSMAERLGGVFPVVAPTSRGRPSLQSRIGADSVNGGAEQLYVEERRQLMGGAS